jgi:DNA-binding MurR/RpiR family transcriptional regulator
MSTRIDRRIAAQYRELSPQERKAADTLLEHLDDLATYRAAELASLADVSKATMSRLFRSLGFDGFDDVRDHVRALRTAGEPRRVEGSPDLSAHAEGEAAAVARAVTQAGVAEAVEAIAGASDVMVAGWRNSYPVALHLRQELTHTRDRVGLAPAAGLVNGEELARCHADEQHFTWLATGRTGCRSPRSPRPRCGRSPRPATRTSTTLCGCPAASGLARSRSRPETGNWW